uniref:Uncharacterized protein n=1 Tax=viral metagenome TaxID=1070528 RepID=A0A6C0IME5_9ZZZZ
MTIENLLKLSYEYVVYIHMYISETRFLLPLEDI